MGASDQGDTDLGGSFHDGRFLVDRLGMSDRSVTAAVFTVTGNQVAGRSGDCRLGFGQGGGAGPGGGGWWP